MDTAEQTKIDPQVTGVIFLLVIVSGTILLFWPYFKWLGISWKSDFTDTFGYLAPVVSAWAVYLKRERILDAPVSCTQRGWVFFIPGLVLSVLFRWKGQSLFACLSLPLYLYGLFLIIWGKERSRYLLFPILFLFFLYPWGDLLDIIVGFQLRRLSVLIAYTLYKIMGMDVSILGTLIYTGRFLVDVAPACSGLTMMNVLFFMGAIGAHMYRSKLGNKILIFFSVIPLAIILNTLRVGLTGLIGHFFGEDTALGFYHNLSGMLVFGLALLALYGEAFVLEKLTEINDDS